MIRKHPRLDTISPPGQIVNPVGVASPVQQEKTLGKEIADYKSTRSEEFKRGYRLGFKNGYIASRKDTQFPPDMGSEAAR